MGRDLEVKVLLRAWSQELIANRKAGARRGEVREDRAEGSGEQTRGSTNRNRIGGTPNQDERAFDREVLATKGKGCRSGDRAGKVTTLTWGDLASCLKGQRRKTEREVSKGRSSGAEAGRGGEPPGAGRFSDAKGRTEGRARRP
jgi:hypothetical protein